MLDNNWHSDSHNLTPNKQICSQIFITIEKVFHFYNSGQPEIESRHNLIMILEIQDPTYPQTWKREYFKPSKTTENPDTHTHTSLNKMCSQPSKAICMVMTSFQNFPRWLHQLPAVLGKVVIKPQPIVCNKTGSARKGQYHTSTVILNSWHEMNSQGGSQPCH